MDDDDISPDQKALYLKITGICSGFDGETVVAAMLNALASAIAQLAPSIEQAELYTESVMMDIRAAIRDNWDLAKEVQNRQPKTISGNA